MHIKTEEITHEKEESQETKTANPRIIMTEEAHYAIYVNFSILFDSFYTKAGAAASQPSRRWEKYCTNKFESSYDILNG